MHLSLPLKERNEVHNFMVLSVVHFELTKTQNESDPTWKKRKRVCFASSTVCRLFVQLNYFVTLRDTNEMKSMQTFTFIVHGHLYNKNTPRSGGLIAVL